MADTGKGSDVSATEPCLIWNGVNTLFRLDGKGIFKEGFSKLEDNLNKRFYTSITTFSEHFSAIISAALRVSPTEKLNESDAHLNGQTASKALLPDYKYRKALVTRIVKAVKAPFEDALRKESELCQKPFEKDLVNLDKLLENSSLSRRDSANLRGGGAGSARNCSSTRGGSSIDYQLNGTVHEDSLADKEKSLAIRPPEGGTSKRQRPPPDSNSTSNGLTGETRKPNGYGPTSSYLSDDIQGTEPLTPPTSSAEDPQPLSRGGIPWYLEPFDPVGTTVHEERWTGRELVRGMSEELSDMDEEELSGLVDGEETEGVNGSADSCAAEVAAKAKARKRRLANARRRMPWG